MIEQSVSQIDIAKEFSRQMRMSVSSDDLSRIIELNAAEENDNVCHSHDFVDANQVMIDALSLFGVEWNSDKAMLCDLAWSIAKGSGFDPAQCENYGF